MATITQKTGDVLLQSGVFTKAAAEARAAALQEPAWLAEKRRAAWTVFEETPMPTLSDESWRRTSLKKVRWHELALDVKPSLAFTTNFADLPADLRSLLDEGLDTAGRMLFINGQLIYRELDPALAEQGVIFTDLQTAARDHADLVREYLLDKAVPASDSKFAAMNAAFWQNGAFLYVPAEIEVDHPFHTVTLLEGEGATSFYRSLVVGELYSKIDYIEEMASFKDDERGLNVGVAEIIAQEGAHIRYVDVQQLGTEVYNFNTKRSIGHEDSMVIWDLGEFGSSLTKTFIDSKLVGDGANMECNGVYFLDGTQHIDIDSLMHHIGYATGGDLLIHGALKDKARSVFIGMIKIDPSGQLTNSYLKNQNLLLDHTARADSIPSLEIDANDVRASHAATVSKVEDEYIFYLQSRGIPRNMAVQMIVEGFFSTIFDRMGNRRIREKLLRTVTHKMTA